MKAMEVIESIELELKKNPPVVWKGEKSVTEYMVRSFEIMKEIAILNYTRGEAIHNATVAEEFVLNEFERMMKTWGKLK